MTNDLLKANHKAQATHLVKINKTYNVGGQSFVLNFFGAGHSLDNVVVWFPDYQILDGVALSKVRKPKTWALSVMVMSKPGSLHWQDC
ncbi:hypothetical protein KUH03_05420 [Sphingobacterium sp. E70]|uniref:hypothetical protein n=1 Tax=Sphingobacterium sp. E70 TaxID=2853439 RepID=UPI00211CBEF4|nr:hypothetical protein [Sphingobacterium sp. E70]ULT26352.1 hypothetical protein KUH03_05420 [Sphingobacterium sp. E70]